MSSRRDFEGPINHQTLVMKFDGCRHGHQAELWSCRLLCSRDECKDQDRKQREAGFDFHYVYLSVNLCLSPATITSNSPGSLVSLLSAPMNDKSSRRSLKVSVRLWPGSRLIFANRRTRLIGGEIDATRSPT